MSLRKFEEYALKLDAKDFACRSKAKAKPQRREPAGSSPRTVPIEKRIWTDVEPRKYLFSDLEVSKKLIHLLRHAQDVHQFVRERGDPSSGMTREPCKMEEKRPVPRRSM